MIQIKVDKLDDICREYTSQLYHALEEKVNSLKILLDVIKDPNQITNFGNKDLHFKTAISIINLTNKSIDKNSDLTKIILHFRTNHPILAYELNLIHKELKIILSDIKNQKLLESKPDKLIDINVIFKNKGYNEKLIKYLFNYNNYRPIIDNYLAKPLGVNVCPYCNRNFVSYIPQNGEEASEEKVIGPTYDHFFHKSVHTFLSLSFYNLIPSCYVCNSNLKLAKEFHHERNINPLIDGFDDDAYFDFELSPDKISGEINFTPILKAKKGIDKYRNIRIFGNDTKDDSGNVRVFKLKEIYATHHDTVEEVYMNFDENNRFYVDSIKEDLKSLGTNEADFYRFHFKNYFEEKDFNKRPLAKLTKDIYLKMKEINDTI